MFRVILGLWFGSFRFGVESKLALRLGLWLVLGLGFGLELYLRL